MDKENKYQSRTAFVKKLPLALFAVFGIGLSGFKFQKSKRSIGNKFKTLSESEANQYLSKMTSSETKQINPQPPPKV